MGQLSSQLKIGSGHRARRNVAAHLYRGDLRWFCRGGLPVIASFSGMLAVGPTKASLKAGGTDMMAL